MNPAAILALISDLYSQVGQLTAECQRLTAERDDLLHRADHAPDPTT